MKKTILGFMFFVVGLGAIVVTLYMLFALAYGDSLAIIAIALIFLIGTILIFASIYLLDIFYGDKK